jgi:hypothetical protein
MLIKLFGVPEPVQVKMLLTEIKHALGNAGFEGSTVRIGFSPVRIRPNNADGPLRILVTGADAQGKERAIRNVVAHLCASYYRTYVFVWRGYEDPALPGQPGPSRGRSH